MGLRDFDRRLLLKRPARTPDGQGGFGIDWAAATEKLVSCRIADSGMAERVVAGKQEGTFSHYVWMHRRQPLERGDRLEFPDGSFLEIETVFRDDVPGGLLKARAWQRQKGQ
jgi:hypothetical protein